MLEAFIDLTSSLFLLGAAGATVAAALGVAGYLWLTVAADVATALLGLGIARHYVRADFRSGRQQVRELIRRAAPLGISQVLISVAVQVDVVLLSLMASLATVGKFGVALQLAVFGTADPIRAHGRHSPEVRRRFVHPQTAPHPARLRCPDLGGGRLAASCDRLSRDLDWC